MKNKKDNQKYIQPYIILGFALWRLISALFLRDAYDNPIATDAILLTELVVAVCLLLYSVTRIIHYGLWRRKAKNDLEEREKKGFYTERMQLLDYVLLVILGVITFVSFTVLSLGNLAESWQFLALGGSILAYIFVVLFIARKKFPIKFTVICAIAAIAIAGIFGVTQLNDKKYESLSKERLGSEGPPVSVMDFGIEKDNCRDKTFAEHITPFGEHYVFRAATIEEIESFKPYAYYEVLISGHKVLDSYEKQIRKRVGRYNSEIKEIQSDKWDYLCREVHEGKETDSGYAVKGDTVVYLDIINDITFEAFFDKAYENIF